MAKTTFQPMTVGSRFRMSEKVPFDSNTYNTQAVSLTTNWPFMYLGRTPITTGVVVVKAYLKTPLNYSTVYTGGYAEMAIYRGEHVIGGRVEGERLGYTDMTNTISAKATPAAIEGVKNFIIAITPTVPPGTPLWLSYGVYSGTGGTGFVNPTFLHSNLFAADALMSMKYALSARNYNSAGLNPGSAVGYHVGCNPGSIGYSNYLPVFSVTFYTQILSPGPE